MQAWTIIWPWVNTLYPGRCQHRFFNGGLWPNAIPMDPAHSWLFVLYSRWDSDSECALFVISNTRCMPSLMHPHRGKQHFLWEKTAAFRVSHLGKHPKVTSTCPSIYYLIWIHFPRNPWSFLPLLLDSETWLKKKTAISLEFPHLIICHSQKVILTGGQGTSWHEETG